MADPWACIQRSRASIIYFVCVCVVCVEGVYIQQGAREPQGITPDGILYEEGVSAAVRALVEKCESKH